MHLNAPCLEVCLHFLQELGLQVYPYPTRLMYYVIFSRGTYQRLADLIGNRRFSIRALKGLNIRPIPHTNVQSYVIHISQGILILSVHFYGVFLPIETSFRMHNSLEPLRLFSRTCQGATR